MVVPLPKPRQNDDIFFQSVIAERMNGKNAQYFNGIASFWKLRIDTYNNLCGNPKAIPASQICDEKDKIKFINLYNNGKKGQYHFDIIQKLRRPEPTLLLCPACGEDGTPNTLDHYLPKTHFPEFSIHLKNLVPMCDICQGIKSDLYVDTNGDKKFLHPYFDSITQPLIWIEIAPPYDSPQRFQLVTNPSLPQDLQNQVTSHVNGLNLPTRIEQFCQTKYSHLIRLVSEHRSSNMTPVAGLISLFLSMAEKKAINSWDAIFYRSVSNNVNLLAYMDTFKLSNHP